MISTATNVAMLFVWIAYLQVFVSSFRRQKRSKILINRGAGSGLEARCLISNMSAEAIYIESLIASVETKEGRWSWPVTDMQEGRSDLKLATRQGPVQAGQFIDIGSFRSLVEPVLQKHAERRDGVAPGDVDDLIAFEIKVIAVHGSEDLLAGAIRRFDVRRGESQLLLSGTMVGTRQIRSRIERRKLDDDVRTDL
ncbi:MAG TPA: hypothetical protein VHL31_19940 [Geminicoccus sp.]|uniref:hypothetical protein n=1 Tax=Geminicoccus sp. TaxID=2024832 RepID=UPI002E3236F4|nr:hypothetical protein [Geminicoccus sp.]HEX2528553.1 hypothetical protein [Geminicoccus sp.]